MISTLATRRALVTAPSPLVGEGMKVIQRVVLGEGASSQNAFFEDTPSPIFTLLNDRPALSHKGRGRSDTRLRSRRQPLGGRA